MSDIGGIISYDTPRVLDMAEKGKKRTRKSIGIGLFFEAFTGIYILIVVVVFWRQPVWTGVLLGGSLVLQLWFWGEKADLAAMVAAALLGTPSEIICVKTGVWTYQAPGMILGIPVWIPLVWASLFCLFRRSSITMLAVTRRIWPDPDAFARKALFRGLGGFIVVYVLLTLYIIKKAIAAVYAALLVPALIFWRGERDVLIFIIGGAVGTLGEYICMKLGFWQYHYPFLRSIGVPLSLPLAWGLSGVIVGRIAGVWEGTPLKK
jgi:hypothetical protein